MELVALHSGGPFVHSIKRNIELNVTHSLKTVSKYYIGFIIDVVVEFRVFIVFTIVLNSNALYHHFFHTLNHLLRVCDLDLGYLHLQQPRCSHEREQQQNRSPRASKVFMSSKLLTKKMISQNSDFEK